MASIKKQAQSSQEVYSCTNQEVLDALLIGVDAMAGRTPQKGPAAQPSLNRASAYQDFSEDSSAEEDEDIMRAHSRIMKQQEFEQMQRDGYVQPRDSSRINQLDKSSRQNLLESGSLQMQNSTSSPNKSGIEHSPDARTVNGQNPELSGSNYSNQFQNNFSQALGGQGVSQQAMLDLKAGLVQSPQTYEMMSNGQIGTNRSGKSGSKRGRPISAYPVPGSYPGFLSQISESVEEAQHSHLSQFTYGLARNNASRKHYVPSNIETIEKEKLYTETISLKKQRNDVLQQNTLLKTSLKGAEMDLRKKDSIIQQLTHEIKNHASQSSYGQFPYAGAINQSSFLNMPPELQGISGFQASRASKQMQGQVKTQQILKQNADFRKRIKELKCDVALKETELQNLQRTLKYTKLKEFEVELATYSQEIVRLKTMLMNEKVKPRVDPAQYAALQNQLIMQQQQTQQAMQQSEQWKQDIEKLTQANSQSKAKLQRCKVKAKKLLTVKKRQDVKIKIMEAKLSEVKVDLAKKASFKGARGSKQLRKGSRGFQGGDAECYDQLQTQLEINQILIDKLDSMGIDVRELIRQSQTQTQQNGQPDVKMVVFTFVGPEGLIEGGDNQQFEMPIDFSQVAHVEQIKEILKKELVMDAGIDLVLREKQSGQVLETTEDIHIAVDSGEGVLVQFVENENGMMNGGANNNKMANINEEDEKSEYSDEQFEEEDEEKEQKPMVPRVTLDQVKSGLKAIRLLLLIKKVPRTHMIKYLLRGETFETNPESGEEVISTKNLVTIFERKFNFGNGKATKIARFFVEGPPASPEENQIEEKEHTTDRESLILRFKEHISEYMLYNSLAIDSMLSRLQGIMDGKGSEFLDDLNLDDEDSNGFLPIEQIQKVWKYSGLPSLDEELTEFMEFLALRHSPSLKKVNYEDFTKVFDMGYMLSDCQHDDETPFDATDEDPDEQDLEKIRNKRQIQESMGKDSFNPNAEQQNQEEEDPEIESDDLMLFIDEALNKIVSKLPETGKKTALNKQLLPLARSTLDQQTGEKLLVLQPQVLIQFMVQNMGVSFSDKELYCLLHILVREQEAGGADSSQGAQDAQDSSGYILYRDVYTLLRNYLRKQKIMDQSVSLGLDYQVLTKATFDFLLKIKQVLNGPDEKQAASDKDHQVGEAQNFREVFAKQISQKTLNTDASIDLIEFDEFFDGLFMKFKIMCPPKDTMDQLKVLLCVQFGPHISEPSFFLVQKIERVLYDLDYVYVNLVKILREPQHEKLQQEAMKRLRQRYDFVARGISKSKTAPASKQPAEEPANARQKGKPRPMSSKPRKGSNENAKGAKKEVGFVQPAVHEEIEDEDGMDLMSKDERKQEYERQKTKDIDFDLPLDGESDEDGDGEVEEDYEDIEDNFAEEIPQRGKKKVKSEQEEEDEVYSEVESDPPIQETKTLKNIEEGPGAKGGALSKDSDEDLDYGGFEEEDIIEDEYD